MKKSDIAKQELAKLLNDRPMPSHRIIAKMHKLGISQRVTYKAAVDIGIIMTSTGFGPDKESIWALPLLRGSIE